MRKASDLRDECRAVRRDCKVMMVELELDFKGSEPFLAREISTGNCCVNSNSLSMALTGYRTYPSSLEILKRLQRYLLSAKLEKLDLVPQESITPK